MKAIALVGGFGTRLRPLTNDIPKQMLPIGGRPMIEWVAEHLASHGIDELILALGYKADSIVDAYSSGVIAGLGFRVVVEPQPLGTAGAIGFAAAELGIDERCVVVNGDVLTDLDVTALVRFHESHSATASIALQPVDDPTRFGIVEVDPQGRVRRFVEKPPAGTEPSNLANAGTYVLEPSVLAGIEPGRAVSIERETFPGLVGNDALYALAQDTYWLDTGTPQQFLAANMDVLEGRRPFARVRESGAPEGVNLRSASISRGCQIAAEATIVRSVVMSGCVVEAGAVVVDSILAPEVTVGASAVVADYSVVGRGEQIPAKAELYGVRQPEPQLTE